MALIAVCSLCEETPARNVSAALKEAVNKSYDYALGVLQGMSDADYSGTTTFAKAPRARWRIIELAHEHSVWTRGELVSYFRLNGMAPPAFDLFGSGAGE